MYEEWIVYEYEGVYDCICQHVVVDEFGNIILVKDTFDIKVPGLMYVNAFGEVINNSRRSVIGFTVIGEEDRRLVPLVK